MGHRIANTTTRTGDGGETGLADGSRVAKTDARIEVIGAVDELNSHLGVLMSEKLPSEISAPLLAAQHALFDLGAELAVPGNQILSSEYVMAVESAVEKINAGLPPLQEVVLPGGGAVAAASQVARTVCRRAERRLLTLAQTETVNPESIRYLNRLSDLLFLVGRALARADQGEVLWQPEAAKRTRGGQ
ncbi:MAG: cob(I)yrinic acid a,c-diamide adenosyltransferase [Gammaproteobacteria bacterium]|nr:MAG: cob(I)yrinic acid a,c-diamide adenosyltransferase [Gammaproteobacteria bacterium]